MTKAQKKQLKKEDETGSSLQSCIQAKGPTAVIHGNGKVNGCAGQSTKEWQSLALVGKFALETKTNIRSSWYKQDHLDEKSIDLKLAN